MGYLYSKDYKRLIQTENLSQIVGDDDTITALAESSAVEEIKSYLRQKYMVDREFKAITIFDYTKAYVYEDRVYLDADTFSISVTYNEFDMVLKDGIIYRALQDGIVGAWVGGEWEAIGSQYDLYHVALPSGFEDFDAEKLYVINDKVVHEGTKYKALKNSTGVVNNIQYEKYENRPALNVYPNAEGAEVFWRDLGAIESTGIYPKDNIIWALGDNRNQHMVTAVLDVMLFHLHKRIAPRNVPALRQDCYVDVIAWLKNIAKGNDISPDLPKIQPRSGARIVWGGNIKQQNSY